MVSRFVSASRFWAAILCVAGVLLAAGCDSMSFVPPRPPELSNPAQTGVETASRTPVVSTPSSTDAPHLFEHRAHRWRGTIDRRGKIVELILAKAAKYRTALPCTIAAARSRQSHDIATVHQAGTGATALSRTIGWGDPESDPAWIGGLDRRAHRRPRCTRSAVRKSITRHEGSPAGPTPPPARR